MGELDPSFHARALAGLGAAQGGRARAQALSPEERKHIARQAAEARWGSPFPRATHTGQLVVVGRALACAVLENSTRVFTQETLVNTLGGGARAKGGSGLHRLLAADNLQPFISDAARRSATPVVFRAPDGGKTFGYEAQALPLVCAVYAQAHNQGTILPEQQPIVRICERILKGLAGSDITDWVDQSTGYEQRRARRELTQILEASLPPVLVPWLRQFPDEFFEQIYRLHGWPCKPGAARPTPLLGKLLHHYVFEQLPEEVLSQLRKPQPVSAKAYRKPRHPAYTGNLHLDQQISIVTAIMKLSDDPEAFERHCAKAFAQPAPKPPLVISAPPPQQTERGKTAAGRDPGNRSHRS
jgi:hypothetical protein